MNKTAWIILGTIFIVIFGGAAGLLAVLLFHGEAPHDDAEPQIDNLLEMARDDEPAAEPEIQPRPELRGADAPNDATASRRMAALEADMRALRAEIAAERAKNKKLHDLLEQAEKGGMVPGDFEAGGPGMEVVGGPESGAALAVDLARKAGLDAERAKALGEQYDRWLTKVEALEKEHAKVAVDGDTTTITIGRFGQAGDQLRREWDDYIAGALSADEKQAYDKQGARNRLLGGRTGDFARTIRIQESGGTIRITEQGDNGKGAKTEQETQGPAIARDLMLEGYAHLLK